MRKERAFEEDAELDARPLLILVEERFALFERLSELPERGEKSPASMQEAMRSADTSPSGASSPLRPSPTRAPSKVPCRCGNRAGRGNIRALP